MRWWLVLASLAALACSDPPAPRVTLELEVPAEDASGALLGDLDSLELRVSDGRAFRASRLFPLGGDIGDALELPEIPTGEAISFHLIGYSMSAELAYGRSCPTVITEDTDDQTVRLYFSRVGRFRRSADPLDPSRSSPLMFADDLGRAVMWGGSGATVVEVFDPRQGAFTAGGEAQARQRGRVAVRDDGTAITAGGLTESGAPLLLVEELVPRSANNPVRQIGPGDQTGAARVRHAMLALPDGSILLSGGTPAAGGAPTADLQLLAAGDDRFRPLGQLASPRAGHSATMSLGGIVYFIGGVASDEDGVPVATIELYRPQDQTLRIVEGAQLAVPRTGHTATALGDGRILIVGGLTPSDPPCSPEPCFDAVEEVEVFDPILGESTPVDAIAGGVYEHSAVAIAGGRILISGGRDGAGQPTADAFVFDPDVEGLVPTRALESPRAGQAATVLCDGTVLVAGGTGIDAEPLPSERYNPAARLEP